MDEENQIPVSDRIINTANTIKENPSEEIISQLNFLINELINEDFQALVQLLYRIDVNEEQLKNLLKQNGMADAAPLIAELIIRRQLQKIESKKQFGQIKKTDAEDSW